MDRKILVIGSANADLTVHAHRMPKLGETVIGKNFSVNCGGKGANQAVAVAKLGGNASFCGALGADSNGNMLLENLENNKVEFKGLVTDELPTGTASITVINGDNFIILDQGANAALTPEFIRGKEDVISESDYILLQLEIPLESVSEASRIARKHKKTVVLNPAPYIALPEELYFLTDIIIPNEHEAKLMTGIELTGESSYKEAIEAIKEKGVKTVIVTLGDKGCVYNQGEKLYIQPAIKVEAVDTTSAGDSFIGAFVTKLARGEAFEKAIEYATRVSSITVTRMGASASVPNYWEVE